MIDKVLFDDDQVFEFLTAGQVEFPPDVLEILEARKPPTVSWFKELPTNYHDRWGVYSSRARQLLDLLSRRCPLLLLLAIALLVLVQIRLNCDESRRAAARRYKAAQVARNPIAAKRISHEDYMKNKARDPVAHAKYNAEKYLRWKTEFPETVQKWYDDRQARVKSDLKLQAHVRELDKQTYGRNQPKKLASKK